MGYWDSARNKVVRAQPQRYEGYPGWALMDCGCCGGLQWGGDAPVECTRCNGGGELALHIASGQLALYPGGPFRGPATPKEITAVVSAGFK